MSPHLAATAEFKRGPFIGSDHLSIHIQLVTKPMQSSNRPPSWNFSEANWENWNTSIRQTIESTDFHKTGDPSRKYQIFISVLHSANTANNIEMKKTSNQMKAEPQRAWWIEECKKAVAQSIKARNACVPARDTSTVNNQTHQQPKPQKLLNKNLGLHKSLDKRNNSSRPLLFPHKRP